jgi:hypothetical protein
MYLPHSKPQEARSNVNRTGALVCLAHAYALRGNTAKVRAAYQDSHTVKRRRHSDSAAAKFEYEASGLNRKPTSV